MEQERPVRVERRLSAIMAADVAGYSRLMHNDEEATLAKLTALLTDAVAPNLLKTAVALSRTLAMGSWRSFRAPSKRFGALCSSSVDALSILAFKYAVRPTNLLSADPQADIHQAQELVSRVLAIEPDNYRAHSAKFWILIAKGRPDEALVEAEKIFDLNLGRAAAQDVRPG
jgi:class 3 adenylate cyclase